MMDEFDQIVMAENSFVQEGYDQGYRDGKNIGYKEGITLGLRNGVEFGSEIGFYKGFVETTLQMGILEKANSRLISTLNNLNELLSTFERNQHQNVDGADILSNVRDKFRQICSLMRLDQDVIPKCERSF